MCVFVSRPMKIVTLLWKFADLPKRVVDFPLERDTFRNKIMEIVEDFDEKSYNNNGKPWKSLRILRLNPFFHFFIHFIFSFFSIFHFSSCSFILYHFPSCSFIFFHVLSFSFMFFHVSFMFFHLLSFSFIFFHVLSFSCIFLHFLAFPFMFFHFLSFSFIFFVFVECSKSEDGGIRGHQHCPDDDASGNSPRSRDRPCPRALKYLCRACRD